MHTQLDFATLMQILAPVLGILLAINGYFIRGLVVKINETERMMWQSNEKIVQLQRETQQTKEIFAKIGDHVSKIDSDIAVLKFAILNQIKKMQVEGKP